MSKLAYSKYGAPIDNGLTSSNESTLFEAKNMVLWDVPTELEIGVIPKRIYCHRDMLPPLRDAFINLIETGFVKELKTWDGCFNVRPIRGYEKKFAAAAKAGNIELAMSYLSEHSWGLAIDVNAAWNRLGMQPTLSIGFVRCFEDAGFVWGGRWKRLDGMHFELKLF